jgi:hypothetical protein
MLAGCAESVQESEPPKRPSKEDLAQIAATTHQPAYWLGPHFRGIKISRAIATRRGAAFSYGAISCEPGSGCADTGGVGTSRRRIEQFEPADGRVDPRNCWTRAGRAVAVLMGCAPDGYPQELVIYSATREIHLTSLYTTDGQGEIPARVVSRGLRPLNANAPWPLPAPAPFTCREFRRLGTLYQRHAPDAIRPKAACARARRR